MNPLKKKKQQERTYRNYLLLQVYFMVPYFVYYMPLKGTILIPQKWGSSFATDLIIIE